MYWNSLSLLQLDIPKNKNALFIYKKTYSRFWNNLLNFLDITYITEKTIIF